MNKNYRHGLTRIRLQQAKLLSESVHVEMLLQLHGSFSIRACAQSKQFSPRVSTVRLYP
jgi:hypothetical protein